MNRGEIKHLFNRKYLPSVLEHFDQIGFELSILVTRWFIPLFATTVHFSLLFRFWDYLFCVGFSGLFRLAVAMLLLCEKVLLQCDIVELSTMIHQVGTERFRREKDIQALFDIMMSLDEVGLIGDDYDYDNEID